MFGILITEENIEKIVETAKPPTTIMSSVEIFSVDPKKDWFFIHGYVTQGGAYVEHTVLPHYILNRVFEYDQDKIRTDWDQIVRK